MFEKRKPKPARPHEVVVKARNLAAIRITEEALRIATGYQVVLDLCEIRWPREYENERSVEARGHILGPTDGAGGLRTAIFNGYVSMYFQNESLGLWDSNFPVGVVTLHHVICRTGCFPDVQFSCNGSQLSVIQSSMGYVEEIKEILADGFQVFY